MKYLISLAVGLIFAGPACADTPRDFLNRFQQESGPADPQRGARIFLTKGSEWSCATCHTEKPTQTGRHAKTDKPIQALAPTANAERFTDPAKVEKWFRRNCNDVFGRTCSAQEKADVLAWLIAQK